ncbi:MAG: hypothetical protein QG671_714 [Actinomycetota bacterium]|nr:hypothetical protein [Actinomycetota bacterium]
MKFAGMFRELGPVGLDIAQESIFEQVLPEDLPDLDDVVRYLESGYELIAMMDVNDDVFDRSRRFLGGSSVLTDGDWLWRDDFTRYVSLHRVAVPDELLSTIRRRDYVVPALEEAILIECTSVANDLMF